MWICWFSCLLHLTVSSVLHLAEGDYDVLSATTADELLRLRGVFGEVPGTRVTSREALICGIDSDRCAALLDALVDVGFLQFVWWVY